MAAKKASPKPGPKPRSDSKQRSSQILFRTGDLYPEFDLRLVNASRAEIAKRDLSRFWTLMNHQLRNARFDLDDVEKIAGELMTKDLVMKGTVAPVLATMIETYAMDLKTSSLLDLSVADSTALMDLFARSESPTDAARQLADLMA